MGKWLKLGTHKFFVQLSVAIFFFFIILVQPTNIACVRMAIFPAVLLHCDRGAEEHADQMLVFKVRQLNVRGFLLIFLLCTWLYQQNHEIHSAT